MRVFKKLMGYEVEEKKQINKNGQSLDLMVFVDHESIGDFQVIADKIIYGLPVLINLDKLSTADGNRLLSFLTGVVYAISGKQFKIKDKIFLFASSQALEDGSIDDFVRQKR